MAAAQAIRRLYVTGTRWTTSKNDVMTYFSQFGKVIEVHQPLNLCTGFPALRGLFVTMATTESVSRIIDQKYHVIEGKNVHVAKSKGNVRSGERGGIRDEERGGHRDEERGGTRDEERGGHRDEEISGTRDEDSG